MASIKFNARHGITLGLNALPFATDTGGITASSLSVSGVSTLGNVTAADLTVTGAVAFTNPPSTTTPALDDNSTKMATTAFLMNQGSSVDPLMNGVVSAGTSLRWSRADHVHASDTTKANSSAPTFTGTVAFSGGTVAVSTPMASFTQTWNGANSSVAFTAFKINVTEILASTSSTLVDLQKGGVTRFAVDGHGAIAQRLSNYNLARDIVSGSRHIREYQDLADGNVNGMDASVFEWGYTFNGKWDGAQYIKDRSNVGDHALQMRLNEGFKQQWWFSDGSTGGSPVLWAKKIDFDFTTDSYTFTGTVGLQNLTVAGVVGSNINIQTGFDYRINNVSVLTNTTLGSTVTQSSLTKVGTISTGVWNGSVIPVAYGGTGASTTSGVGGVLDNLLPAGEAAGYVLKTSGAGTYYWDIVGSSATPIGSTVATTTATYSATAGQTIFTGVPSYTIGAKQLRVYINGVRQDPSDFVENTSTQFTLLTPCAASDVVFAEVVAVTAYDNTAAGVAFTPTGNIASIEVQSALVELDNEKAGIAQTMYIGTTALALNRVSGALTLTGVSIDGTAANATALQSLQPSTSAIANTIVARDANGYIYSNFLNTTDNAVTTGVTGIVVKAGDNFHRTGTAAAISTFLGLSSYAPIASPTFTGTASAPLFVGALQGNADTATVLATGRTINGVSFNGSANITITANTTTALTFNNSGAGVASGTTFNGSTARTVSYNTIGAAAVGQTMYIGTTALTLNRTSLAQTLTGVSIDGNAATASSVAWTNVSGRPLTVSSFTNDSGYISGISSADISTALGYTPATSTHTHSYEVPLTFSTGLTRTSNTITANFGSTAGTICQGNDARLSDARTPLTHTHSYLDLSGGILTGNLTLDDGVAANNTKTLTINGYRSDATTNFSAITATNNFDSGTTTLGVYGLLGEHTWYFNSAKASTSKTTGAVRIAGGLGVAGDVYATTFVGNLNGVASTVSSVPKSAIATLQYTSPEYTIQWNVPLVYVATHNLGQTPDSVSVVLRCVAADGLTGWVAGDEILINSNYGDVSMAGSHQHFTWSNSTQVGLIVKYIGSVFVHKTTGAAAGLNQNNWRVVLRASLT